MLTHLYTCHWNEPVYYILYYYMQLNAITLAQYFHFCTLKRFVIQIERLDIRLYFIVWDRTVGFGSLSIDCSCRHYRIKSMYMHALAP